MSSRPLRRFSDVQKTKAVLAHVQDGVPVSQVCEDLGIHPNQYYEWQKQAFSSLPHVFSRDAIRQERGHQREVKNIFIERLWRSVKYEKIFLEEFVTVPELLSGLKDYFKFYNFERPHQSLVGKTSAEIYWGREVAKKAA